MFHSLRISDDDSSGLSEAKVFQSDLCQSLINQDGWPCPWPALSMMLMMTMMSMMMMMMIMMSRMMMMFMMSMMMMMMENTREIREKIDSSQKTVQSCQKSILRCGM